MAAERWSSAGERPATLALWMSPGWCDGTPGKYLQVRSAFTAVLVAHAVSLPPFSWCS